MKDLIQKQQQLNFPIKEVWKAISSSDEITAWFIKADFKAEEGYEYTFTHENTTISGRVLKADPFTDLVYTWEVGGTGIETTVKWTLEENDQGTLVSIEHSGISGYPTEEMATNMFNSFSEGWSSCLVNLDKYLNKELAN